ncbi:hypothetical protein A2U01_0106013, partial [Trifolium medium]|nr:hypothetical protein [Trifolium medium]
MKRLALWDTLKEFAEDIHGPWAVMRDFNAITATHERIGGVGAPSYRSLNAFQHMIQD